MRANKLIALTSQVKSSLFFKQYVILQEWCTVYQKDLIVAPKNKYMYVPDKTKQKRDRQILHNALTTIYDGNFRNIRKNESE